MCIRDSLLLSGRMESRTIGVRAPVADDPGQARLRGPAARVTGEGDSPGGRTVVAAIGGHDLVPPRVQARHPDGVLVGLSAAVGEEDGVEVPRGDLRNEPCSFLSLIHISEPTRPY